jgi:hypothetical protein
MGVFKGPNTLLYKGLALIYIEGKGLLRNNPLELQRALEILQAVLYREVYPSAWVLRYGEIPEMGQRIDAIIELQYPDDSVKRIGVEVVSSNGRDIKDALNKLEWLISLGRFHRGYIYVRPLEGVQRSVAVILKNLIEVK